MRDFSWLLVFALIPPAIGAASPDYPADLSKWVKTDPPRVGDDRWFTANHDVEHVWTVYMAADRASARLRAANRERGSAYPERQESYPRMPFVVVQGSAQEGNAGEWFSVQASDGWIIGFNAGEWGGGLWWYSPDGKRRYKISDVQVVGFFKTDAGLFALEGIAHMSISRGQIVKLVKGAPGRWMSSRFVDLGGAPEVGVVAPDGLLTVATHDRLLRVNLVTKGMEVLLANAFWGGLYPTSMVIAPSGAVYIGMRHGVAEVEKAGGAFRAKWLIPTVEFDRAHAEGFR